MLKRAMPAVGSQDPVLLILGSLPGDASLAVQRYYAHPRNQFWRLLGGALGEPLAQMDYPARLDRLAERGVALWDVVQEARRPGSLDTAIRDVVPHHLIDFVVACPSLRAIAFNGGTAARLGQRALVGVDGPILIDLPSSSPAFTRAVELKARDWAALGTVALPAKRGRMGS